MLSNFVRAACLVTGVSLMAGLPARVAAQDANRDSVVTMASVSEVVDRLAKRTGDFKSSFNHEIEKSIIDGTKLEDRVKNRADDLHDAAQKMKDEFHDKKDKNHPKVREKVDRTLAAAADINRIMVEHRFTDKLQREWASLRADLNGLAAVYDLSPLQ
jgi:hypothetical protein